MRTLELYRGKYKGKHNIYEEKEAKKIGLSFVKWRSTTEIERGQWVMADDGYILELLSKRVMKSSPTLGPRIFYRFPNGTRYAYWKKKDQCYGFSNFYGSAVSLDKNSAKGAYQRSLLTIGYDEKKMLWVSLVSGGMDPLQAVRFVYKNYMGTKMTQKRAKAILIDLLSDENIRKHLVENTEKELKNELVKTIKKKEGVDSLEEFVAMKLADALVVDGKSIRDKIAQARLSLDLVKILDMLPNIDKTKKKSKSGIIDADFEELAPPK